MSRLHLVFIFGTARRALFYGVVRDTTAAVIKAGCWHCLIFASACKRCANIFSLAVSALLRRAVWVRMRRRMRHVMHVKCLPLTWTPSRRAAGRQTADLMAIAATTAAAPIWKLACNRPRPNRREQAGSRLWHATSLRMADEVRPSF